MPSVSAAAGGSTLAGPASVIARGRLALERKLGVPAPLVPGPGVVPGAVAGRAEGERRQGRARAGVTVRDDLGALGLADERADLLGAPRPAGLGEERRDLDEL